MYYVCVMHVLCMCVCVCVCVCVCIHTHTHAPHTAHPFAYLCSPLSPLLPPPPVSLQHTLMERVLLSVHACVQTHVCAHSFLSPPLPSSRLPSLPRSLPHQQCRFYPSLCLSLSMVSRARDHPVMDIVPNKSLSLSLSLSQQNWVLQRHVRSMQSLQVCVCV